ncbi:MAG TPA: hypothetical protein VI146_03555, partial [Nitrososphaeraceae archaeon]
LDPTSICTNGPVTLPLNILFTLPVSFSDIKKSSLPKKSMPVGKSKFRATNSTLRFESLNEGAEIVTFCPCILYCTL